MLRNYLTIAFRNLLKYKSYSLINVASLAIGMACCVLILLWVQDELSFDSFHENGNRIVRITQEENLVTPALIAPVLKRELADIENAARFYNATQYGPYVIRHGERLFQEKRFFFADSTVFDLFTFPLIAGDASQALTRPRTVVITSSMADKYFGEEDPMGQILSIDSAAEYEVTGVIEDIPQNSHLQFDFLASYVSLRGGWARNETSWDSANLLTYLLLTDEAAVATLDAKIAALIEERFGAQLRASGTIPKLPIQRLRDIHLRSKFRGETNGDITYVYSFSAIATLILFIACINYMNLATARSTRRAREVGMRKVLGAARAQLSRQFFGESAVVTGLALGLSVVLIHLFLPTFNSLSGKSLTIDDFDNPFFLTSLFGVGILVSMMAGIYPALLLSGFQPIVVLQRALSEKAGHSSFRSRLVVFQFAVSIALIVATVVVKNQLDYVRTKNLGFDKDQIAVLPIGDRTLQQSYRALKAELLQHSEILSAAAADGYPGNQLGGYRIGAEGLPQEDHPVAGGMVVDEDIVETLGMELLSGRGFPETYAPEQGYFYLVNEVLLKQIGWSLDEALGRQLNLHGRKGPLVGVAKDFHFMSLHNPIHPLAMFLSPLPRDYEYLLVKIRSQDIRGVMAFMGERWREVAPHRPFEYSFLDQEFDALYRAEEGVGR
ncbi:ABC transporter permease, partial [bacterium]|nr:ABC transporter permease [bacterium]